MVLLTLAIVVLPTAVYAWGRTSASFDVKQVVVSGSELVPARRLQRLLNEDYTGRNLFTVTREDVRLSLKEFPYVAGAAVDRDFPSTLRVEILEHRPAAFALAANGWFVISDGGHVIASAGTASDASSTPSTVVEDPPDETLPLATPLPSASATAAARKADEAAAENAKAQAAAVRAQKELAALKAGPKGSKLRLPRFAVADPLKAGESLRDADGRLAVSIVVSLPESLVKRVSVVAVEDGRATLSSGDNLTILWGSSERRAAKALALRTVLAHYAKKGKTCTFIDVSLPDRVLARPQLD